MIQVIRFDTCTQAANVVLFDGWIVIRDGDMGVRREEMIGRRAPKRSMFGHGAVATQRR